MSGISSPSLWQLLHYAEGTDASAAAANVDTFAFVAGALSLKDVLKIEVELESVTQQTAGAQLYHVTDAAQIGYLQNNGAIAAGAGGLQEATMAMRQNSSVLMATVTQGGSHANGNLFISGVFTLTTLWTAAWTLALRHTGVTAGGTFKYRWWIWVKRGQ